MLKAVSINSYMFSRVSINLAVNFLQGLLVVGLMPLATLLLSPADYGVYAMAVLVVTCIVATCEYGASYVLYGHFSELDERRRASLQATLVSLSLLIGTFAAIGVFLAWQTLVHFVPLVRELNTTEKWLLCLCIPLRACGTILNPILILHHRSVSLSVGMLLQATLNFIVVLTCLYIYDVGRTALFWGQFVGVMGCSIFSVMVLGRSAFGGLSWKWLNDIKPVAFMGFFGSIMENVRSALEGALIAKQCGAASLGLFNNARVYQGMLTQSTNAFANVLWPIALEEAQQSRSRFQRIAPVWDFVYVCLGCVGVAAVFLGEDLASALTHGKFREAGVWLPWLVMYVLIQNAGKPATAVMFANKRGQLYSRIRVLSLLSAILALFVFVPRYGVNAVVVVLLGEMILTRVLLAAAARRVCNIPFQDQWVVVGCLSIIICWIINDFFGLSLAIRFGLVVVTSMCLFLGLIISLRIRLVSNGNAIS